MSSEIGSIMDSLNDLLEAERAALLAGNLEKLTSMAERKEALIEALNAAEQTDLELLQELDSKVKRNQTLLNGALDGIRTVARRMAAFRRVRGSLETYDATPLSVLRKPFASNRNEPVVVSIISGDSEFALNSVAVVTGKKPRPRTAKSVEFDVLINAPSSLIKRCELARTPPAV